MRSALALVLVLCAATALADTRKVEVVTDPPGATVYLGDLDSGAACAPTPCSVNAPAGKKTPVIARKDGYAAAFGVIDLRKGSIRSVSLELTATTGRLVCDDPRLAGATVSVDDVDKGKCGGGVQVEATGHRVVVTVKGHVAFEDFITVPAGEDYAIKPNKPEPAPLPPKPTPNVAITEPGGNDVIGDDTTAQVTKTADVGKPREPSIVGGAVFEVGFRQFSYDHPQNLPQFEDEGGQILIGPSLQLWPTRLLGSEHLRGLSLYGKVGFGVNHKPVLQDPNAMPTGASTFWGNIEVDLQQRWNLGDTVSIEIGGGFVRDQLVYNYDQPSQIANIPIADYKSLRLGVRAGFRLGPVEPFVQLEGRVPFSEGVLASRFASTDVTGAGATAGLAAMLGPIVARLEASIVYYSWTITNDATGSGAQTADGATDVIEGISLILGVGY